MNSGSTNEHNQEQHSGFLWAGLIRDLSTLVPPHGYVLGNNYTVRMEANNAMTITQHEPQCAVTIHTDDGARELNNAPIIRWKGEIVPLDNTDLQDMIRSCIEALRENRNEIAALQRQNMEKTSENFSRQMTQALY